MGRAVVNWWGATDRLKNATVIREVGAAEFYGLLLERIGRSYGGKWGDLAAVHIRTAFNWLFYIRKIPNEA